MGVTTSGTSVYCRTDVCTHNVYVYRNRFEQCALVGDTVDHASLGGGSLMGQEAVGHWLFTQHSVVAMPSEIGVRL